MKLKVSSNNVRIYLTQEQKAKAIAKMNRDFRNAIAKCKSTNTL